MPHFPVELALLKKDDFELPGARVFSAKQRTPDEMPDMLNMLAAYLTCCISFWSRGEEAEMPEWLPRMIIAWAKYLRTSHRVTSLFEFLDEEQGHQYVSAELAKEEKAAKVHLAA